ncbi:hypothetical protein FisN_3Lh099 [Fistulifera solaris]|uniref:PHD-type domain-containing protein n=1 Tax=Fistulifera solaris TaxID=1519565 RepID=A0A1Z5JYR2_FISSO|nr:hypothetical protein FisN_3Lh099 [Fistulifera solaris]|eukprot:GAX19155.1 hypothetical protein FisN_3Lh099 [Fistulifera solaris]
MAKKVAAAPEKSASVGSSEATRHNNQLVKDDATEEGSIDIGACSLCHCALDFSDRAAFFQSDREEDYKEEKEEDASSESSYFFNKNDPYLPESLWDPNNALVYCDSCERMFHQKCHFVPIFSVPRGAWHCLYCISQKHIQSKKNSKKSLDVTGNQKRIADPLPDFFMELDAADVALPSTASKNNNSKPASNRDLLFVSPPIPEVVDWERRWEAASRLLKAATWHGAFSQLRNAISGQLATHRLAQAGLQTWTSTSHNFHFFQNSQELHDTLIKMFGAEYRIRGWLLAIETCRSTWPGEKMWRTLLEWTQKHEQFHTEFVKRVLFPFGRMNPRRMEPKTPEYRFHGEEAPRSILDEADISEKALLSKGDVNDNVQLAKETRKINNKQTDDDSGITLDELVCCICLEGYATDENDLVLCDGNGCFRAYHQHCVKPVIRLTEHEEDDWFCPLCAGQAELLHHVQSEYMGDEWEQRRIQRQLMAEGRNAGKSKKKTSDVIDDSTSLRSWADVNDVFPNAEVDYPAAIMLRKGKKNAASIALVNRILGLEEDTNGEVSGGDEDGSDDDEKFDLNSYERRKKVERQNAKRVDNDSSNENITVSSAATLEEISSVELEIHRDELAALSDGEADGADENQFFEKDITERNANGMRLRSKRLYDNTVGHKVEDIGKLDESNIIVGKRGRAPVDYILLNRSIFGDLSQDEAAEIDDDDDFVMKQTDVTGRYSDSTSASSEDRSPFSESDPLMPATNSLDGSRAFENKTAKRSRKRDPESACTSRPSNGETRSNQRVGE